MSDNELERHMREVLLQLALTSSQPSSRLDGGGSTGHGTSGVVDYCLVDDRGRGRVDSAALRFAAQWDAARDDNARAAVLEAARSELDHIRRRSQPDAAAVESREDRDRRIVEDGAGWPAQTVAIAMRCGVRDVHNARAAAGRDLERGQPRRDAREMSRDQRKAEILRLHAQGLNPHQIATALGIPRSSIRYVLARHK